jgi:hypothetical protein
MGFGRKASSPFSATSWRPPWIASTQPCGTLMSSHSLPVHPTAAMRTQMRTQMRNDLNGNLPRERATGQSCGQDHHRNDAARARRYIRRFHNQPRGLMRRNMGRAFKYS